MRLNMIRNKHILFLLWTFSILVPLQINAAAAEKGCIQYQKEIFTSSGFYKF
jgi:hypothetical protein